MNPFEGNKPKEIIKNGSAFRTPRVYDPRKPGSPQQQLAPHVKKPKHLHKKGGHPSALTPGLTKKIVALVRAGCTIKKAAQAVGIWETQIYNWIAQGMEEMEGPFYAFALAVRKAQAECENKMAQVVVRQGRYDWRAALAWLERRGDPADWAKPEDRAHAAGASGATVQAMLGQVVEALKDDPETAKKVADKLWAAGGGGKLDDPEEDAEVVESA